HARTTDTVPTQTGMPAAAAVARVGLRIGFTAVGVDAVAVVEAAGATRNLAGVANASNHCVGDGGAAGELGGLASAQLAYARTGKATLLAGGLVGDGFEVRLTIVGAVELGFGLGPARKTEGAEQAARKQTTRAPERFAAVHAAGECASQFVEAMGQMDSL